MIPSPQQIPLVLLLGLTVATHAPTLPPIAWPLFLLAAASRRLPARRTIAAFRIVALLATYATASLAWGWISSDTLRLTLLGVLLLKWAESKSAAEESLVVAAALVAVAIGSLNWSEAAALIWIVLALACALVALSSAGRDKRHEHAPRAALGAGLRALRPPLFHLAAALPLAGVLFLFFPRIPGPLWDIGLSFGLPLVIGIDQSPTGLGVSASLKPGQTQTGAQMSASTPVLVAEFDSWVPPTAQLYWRGPVFYDFDGLEWKLNSDIATSGRRYMAEGWRSARSFTQEQVAKSTQQVRYTVRLTPHKATWLYALDLPTALPSEAFVTADWQVISHLPVDQEMTYPMISGLEWTAKPDFRETQRERALALPATGNPRLRRLGQELRKAAAGETDPSDSVVRAALTHIVEGAYTIRENFAAPQGADAFDAFWFDTRAGNAEFFAGAFVFLMRTAGVPARLVTGYRGGKLMALTNYVVVKRSHAHAWAEILDPQKGWRRVDPVDIVALQKRSERGPDAKERERNADATSPEPPPETPEKNRHQAKRPLPNGEFAEGRADLPQRSRPEQEEASLLEKIAGWIGHWIVHLDAERQLEILAGKGGAFAWVWLLLGAGVTASTIVFAGIALSRWRDIQRLPPAQRAWQKACAALARHGLALAPTECPQRYAQRVGSARPDLAVGVRTLADSYSGWRYGKRPDDCPLTVTKAARYLLNLIEALPAARAPGKTKETQKK